MSKKVDPYTRFEVILQEDNNGDLLLPIPPILLEKLNWKEGDDIEVSIDELGRYVLRKV